MGNVNAALPKEVARCSYDLKGSWVDRSAGSSGAGPRKDNDLLQPVCISEVDRTQILAQLESDSLWLQRWNIMDYSLLLTVTKPADTPDAPSAPTYSVGNTQRRISSRKSSGLDQIAAAEFVVCVGLIDVLQEFNCSKMCERAYKSIKKYEQRDGLSCVPSELYQRRFMAHMTNKVLALNTHSAASNAIALCK